MLAGGQSLLPLLKMRLASAETLVDIGRIPGLKGVRRLDDGRVAIGALTTYAELMDSPVNEYGLLRDALPNIGDVQVRNRGTIGGAIAHQRSGIRPARLPARPGGGVRHPVRRGRAHDRGRRVLPGRVRDRSRGRRDTSTEVRLPGPRDDAGSAYTSLEQPASGYALVGVAVVVFGGNAGGIASANVALTGVSDHAYRARAVEAALVGSDGSAASIASAAEHATDGVEVSSDIHADRGYRTAMAVVYTRRAIEAALARLH